MSEVLTPAGASPATAHSDEELLERIRERDVDALEALYDRYSKAAFALAYRILGNREVAEEVTQDAFMSVWRQAATYKPGMGKVRPWLLSIAHHRAIDRTRRVADRNVGVSLDEAWMKPSGDDVFGEVYQGLQRQQIQRALGELPAQQRTAISLAYFNGNTFVEIAEMMDVPVGTVKSRVRLGLEKLKNLLDAEMAR